MVTSIVDPNYAKEVISLFSQNPGSPSPKTDDESVSYKIEKTSADVCWLRLGPGLFSGSYHMLIVLTKIRPYVRHNCDMEPILVYEPTDCTDFDTFTIQGTGSTASESDGGKCLDKMIITVSHTLLEIIITAIN